MLLRPGTNQKQPQQASPLNRSSIFATWAQAILSPGLDVNYSSGRQLVRAGGIYNRSNMPGGLAWNFRKDFYVETESLPAIGTTSYVEFWYGYPSSDLYSRGSNTAPGMLTGQNNNMMGICGTVGTNSSNNGGGSSDAWGAVYNWPSLNSALETLPVGQLTLTLVVRRQSGMEFWRDGRMVRFISQSPTSVPAGTFICGSFVENTDFWSSASDTILAGRVLTPIEPSVADIQAFFANPWQVFAPPPRRMWSAALAVPAANTAITPTSGAIQVTGYAPSMVRGVTTTIAPGAGSVAVTGYSPSIVQGMTVTVSPNAGTATVSGYVPTISQGSTATISPGAGSVVATGYAPAVAQSAVRSAMPGAGSIAVSTYAPTVVRGTTTTIASGVGNLAVAGYAPLITQGVATIVSPTAGVAAVSGFAPTVRQTTNAQVAPNAAVMQIAGYAPAVARIDSRAVAPSNAAMSVTGYAPMVLQYNSVTGTVQYRYMRRSNLELVRYG